MKKIDSRAQAVGEKFALGVQRLKVDPHMEIEMGIYLLVVGRWCYVVGLKSLVWIRWFEVVAVKSLV